MKASFYTLGCRLNQYETETIAETFKKNGYEITDFNKSADVYVINTCTVTERSDSDCRQIIRQAIRRKPDAKVVVMGCYAQTNPEAIKKIDGVSLVIGNNDKYRAVHFLNDYLNKRSQGILIDEPMVVVNKRFDDSVFYDTDIENFHNHTRAYLKIQDGCDFECSYCIIPTARGQSRSRSLTDTLRQAEKLAGNGYKEIVLTGVNIGYYGYSFGDREGFKILLKEMEKMEGLSRIRISSIEPNTVDEEIIDIISNSEKICPHFHLPLQSGSDKILKKMKRRYLTRHFRELIKIIEKKIPEFGLGTDVIVGFPGETDEDFEKTYNFINSLPFSYLHVFSFSKRSGTFADELPEQISPQIKQQRSYVLRTLGEEKKKKFYEKHLGKTVKVLWESKEKNGEISGLTEKYLKVFTKYDETLINKIKSIKINYVTNDKAYG
jgi:threonylcarbamoyladenosine tRNA methylthiotransferase MtaB